MFQTQGRTAEALRCFQQACGKQPEFAAAHSNLLLAMHYDPAKSPEEIFAEHRKTPHASVEPARSHSNDPTPDRRLRIGYLSPDFRSHSVAFFFEPVIEAHDRAAFEVTCYSNVPRPDHATLRFERLADRWRNVRGLGDEAAAALIRADGIDILIDLAGHTGENRLDVMARKPAPVAVTWLGYPDTTGLPQIDYRITDAWADPPGASERFHTEELVRLPGGFLCYMKPRDVAGCGLPPCERTGHITFGSFNNFSKLNPQVAEVWSAILDRVPGSRLLLKSKALGDQGARQRARELFRGRDGVELLARNPSVRQHLEIYGRVDIALDPFPYNGTTTTCEALWMGVPVVALAGRRHAGRASLSLLASLGLEELIAESVEDYARIAAGLAGDPARLRELRATLRRRMAESRLTDAQTFTRVLESAYRTMWRRWCERTL